MSEPVWPVGAPVAVRTRFERSWARGFEVEDERFEGDAWMYRVRRRSDSVVLPASFGEAELRTDDR